MHREAVLAWVVQFDDYTQVWINAETGRLIGGIKCNGYRGYVKINTAWEFEEAPYLY